MVPRLTTTVSFISDGSLLVAAAIESPTVAETFDPENVEVSLSCTPTVIESPIKVIFPLFDELFELEDPEFELELDPFEFDELLDELEDPEDFPPLPLYLARISLPTCSPS